MYEIHYNIYVLVTQSYLTLPPDELCSLPDSSVLGILQVRMLEWVAIFFSRGSSWFRDQTWSPELQTDSLLSDLLSNILFFAV